MPIRIQYEPVAAIGQAALLGGLGQYAQRQQELFLRQQAIDRQAENDRMRLAAQLANQQQDRLDAYNRMGYETGRQAAMEGLRHRNDLERLGTMERMRADAAATRRTEELADMAARDSAAEAARLFGYEARTAEDMAGDVEKAMAGYAKQQPYFTPQGAKTYTDLQTKWAAIAKQRPLVRPAQFAELVGQFQAEMARSGLNDHIQTPKPTPEAFEEETVEIPGRGIFARDRSGAWRQVAKDEVNTPAPATFEERYRNWDDYAKDYAATEKELWTRAKEAAEAKALGEGKTATVPPPPPSQEEVLKAMRERFAGYQQIQQEQRAAAAAAGQQQPQQQPATPPPPMPGQPATPPPPHPSEILASLPVQAFRDESGVMTHLPVVPTPEIAAMLPPGTPFITPDGRRKRVPTE